jgi:hypothetical protein
LGDGTRVEDFEEVKKEAITKFEDIYINEYEASPRHIQEML